MRRLSLQIYLSFLAVLLVFAVLSSVAWWALRPDDRLSDLLDNVARVVALVLPEPGSAQTTLDERLLELARGLHLDLAVHAPDGRRVAGTGRLLPPPPLGDRRSQMLRGRRGRPGSVALALPDGRWLLARHRPPPEHNRGFGFGLILLGFAAALGIGAYPLVRRLTGRLERLRARVEDLGSGDLSARVAVEGNDEIAALATSFNEAAARIERLVEAQKTTLASASHELRSPLARMRVAIELLGDDARPEIRARLEADIRELDELIGELLLTSRLDAAPELDRTERVDLLALLAEEAARTGAELATSAETGRNGDASLPGNARLLRRLVRNLLENARRHAAGSPVEAELTSGAEVVILRVCDRGPGVPESERERIFEPFYRPAGMRESGEGAGLGLALVRQIAELHRGTARCLPREGGGSCFEVRLPADRQH
jgi:signal transduction histidine kinase